ncbi:MAG TPA: hypothetical protein VHE59_16980 [Mucilaginibacter sp.]|nr:hypothetical protein [Mucilaginibacter sp.]
MKVLRIIFLLALPFFSYGQINTLNHTEDQVKKEIPERMHANFKETTYTNSGVKLLLFDFALNSEIAMAAFYFNDSGKCIQCIYAFKDDSAMDRLVQSIKSTPGWEKVPDKFEYANYGEGYYVMFVRTENEPGFKVAFNLIDKKSN